MLTMFVVNARRYESIKNIFEFNLNLISFKAYYGGEARCDVELAENFNPEELVCGGCSDIAKAQVKLTDLAVFINLKF